jgi:hypothetical protein
MTNNFLGDLIAKQLPDGYRWELYEGFTYRIGAPDGVQYVHIPKGFVTDFASIPRGLWNLFPPAAGKHSKPAVVHDAMYKTGCCSVDGCPDPRPMTRGECDDIFKEAMGVAGVNWLAKQIIYAGVRVGGWRAWAKHRKAEADAGTTAA